MANSFTSDWDELAPLLLDSIDIGGKGAAGMTASESAPRRSIYQGSPLLAALQHEGVSLERMVTNHTESFRDGLSGLLEQTRDALNRGQPLHHVVSRVLNEAVQGLRTDQPDVAAAAAASAHFYGRLSPHTLQNLVGRGASFSLVPAKAPHLTTATYVEESPAPPTAQAPIAFAGFSTAYPPVPTAEAAPHADKWVGKDGARVGTTAEPAERDQVLKGSSPSLGMEAAPAWPLAAEWPSLFEATRRESHRLIMETMIPGASPEADELSPRPMRKSCDFCFRKKVACRSRGDGSACNCCRRKAIPCVFRSTHKPGRKPDTKRFRGEPQAETSQGLTKLASTAAGVERADCSAKPSSHRGGTNGRRLPSVATHMFYAPSARTADPVAREAVAAAPLPLRDGFSGVDTLVSGSKRRSRDFVSAFDDSPAGGGGSIAGGVTGGGEDGGNSYEFPLQRRRLAARHQC